MLSILRQERDYFFSGLSFYTRIPCPSWVTYSAANFNKSRKYLALIGMLVGGCAVLVYTVAAWVLPVSISILLSMVATVYLTGAFHEDGFADSCDGFGGGWEKAQILNIMKDSRVGSYGVIGLVLILGLKLMLLLELQQQSLSLLIVALIGGHALSRVMASLVMQHYDYVSQLETSKSQSVAAVRLSALEMLWSVLPVSLLVLWGASLALWVGVILMLLVTLLMGQYFKRKVGGYTGDCLGAVQQVTEVVFYMALLMKI